MFILSLTIYNNMNSWYHRNKEAVRNKRADRIARNRAYLDVVKNTNKCCSMCGYSEDIRALKFVPSDFNIRNKYDIVTMVNNAMSIESIDKALDICTLVCMNCYTIFFSSSYGN